MDSQEDLLRELQHIMQELKHRLQGVEERLARLEDEEVADRRVPDAPPAPPPPPPQRESEPEPEPVTTVTAATADRGTVASEPAEEAPRASASGLEEIIGGRWALWIGVILLLISVGFGLAYGWALLSPLARIAIGATAGVAIVLASECLRGRAVSWFTDGIAAAGAGILYLTIWGAVVRYDLIGSTAGLALMVLVVGIAVAEALRHDAQALLVLATLGGYLAPALLPASGDFAAHFDFWTYVTVVNAGLLAAVARKRWPGLRLLVFACLIVLLPGPIMGTQSTAAPMTFLFLTANFLIFLGIGTVHPLRRRLPADVLDIIYLCAVPAAYLVGGTHLLRMQWEWADGVLAIALALVYVLLYIEARNRLPEDRALTTTALTLAVVFTVIAPALLVDGDALTLAWALQAGALAGIGHYLRHRLLRGLSIPTWIFALGASLIALMERIQSPEMAVFNARFGTLAAVVVAGTAIAELLFRASDLRPNARTMGEMMLWMATPLLLLAASLEVYDFVDLDYWSNDAATWYIMATVWALIAFGLHAYSSRRHLHSTPVLTVTAFGAAVLTILIQIGSSTLYEDIPVFGNLRFASVLVTGGAMIAAALLERRWGQDGTFSEHILWVLGVLMLALAPTVETYVAVQKAATVAPTAAGLLAAATVWAFLSTLIAAIGSDRSMRLMLPLGVVMTIGALAVTLIVSETIRSDLWSPILNLRILAFAVCIGSLAIESHVVRKLGTVEEDESGGTVLAVSAALIALWPLTKEVHAVFAWSAYPSEEMWRNAAQVGISLSWAAYAVISLAWGMTRMSRIARWLGLIVLAAGVLKLFLWDLSFLEQPYRIMSFGVLGLVLIGVAWAYSRYADRLRDLA